MNRKITKILGHFDMTAVLKHVNNFNKNIGNGHIDYEGVNILFTIYTCQAKGVHIFPNKPLNLYTDQELKDLLDLLNKLK